ncbi:hypothetical protein AAG906_005916 [Vitis piasezkii]
MSLLRSGFRPDLMGLPEMVQAASSSLFGPFSVGDFKSYDGTLWLDKSAALLNASDSCVQMRGFMPCTTSTVGNLFLIMVYDYLMFLAATCLLPGIELLLASLDPIRKLHKVKSLRMELLAGSTVMFFTVIRGTRVIVSKCDLQDSVDKDSQE